MKSHLIWLACAALVAWSCCGSSHAQDATPAVALSRLLPLQPTPETQTQGGIVTLYALDPLARGFCFRSGREGFMFMNQRVSMRCSDLSFSPERGDSLVTGVGAEPNRAGAVGAIIDLGTGDELRARYGYDDPAGVGYASLRIYAGKIVLRVLNEDSSTEKIEPLEEAVALFSTVATSASAAIVPGHIYILRLGYARRSRVPYIVKFMVIAHSPNQSVTLRWQQL